MTQKPNEAGMVSKQVTLDEAEMIDELRTIKFGIIEIHVVKGMPNKVDSIVPGKETDWEIFSVAKSTRIGMMRRDRFKS